MSVTVYRATSEQAELAYAIVQEYYEEAAVQLREGRDEFESQYFGEGAGVWLAESDGDVVGCVALRRLAELPHGAEIKRMYLRATHRGHGVADALLDALENYARAFGYQWLYLDTAADMVAAARFYKRKGFVACEPYNKNPQAAIFMRKRAD
ncbi:MAG TPA: GNAT family N-acetyltransferase [Candidatus Sulfotelmatobacter sp.]|nr:GNAT family N-acetyltransferase [Candidatus Sulfotelmatobacter sp.]